MPRKRTRRRRWPILLGVLLAALAVLIVYMGIQSTIVHLEIVEVPVPDLPPAFDGTRVLFVTDLHVNPYTSVDQAGALMDQLMDSQPDLLLFGGDFTDHGTYSLFTGHTPQNVLDAELTRRAQLFIRLGGLETPLGKFAVAGNHDRALDLKTGKPLEEMAALSGITFLTNRVAVVEKDGAKLVIAGLDDWRKGQPDIAAVASQVQSGDCVILLSHNPDALPSLGQYPAADGGPWADLVLAGHTHGWQVYAPLVAKFVRFASDYGYVTGWYQDGNTKMLVSNGTGTVALPLRLNAPAQAHLLILRRSSE